MPAYRVFISAVSNELADYRREVAQVLRRKGLEVCDQEQFRRGRATLIEQLRDYIRQCDAVICLVGDQYGNKVSAEHAAVLGENSWFNRFQEATGLSNASCTQWEFLLAKAAQRSTYTFMTAPGFKQQKRSRDSAARQQAQAAFRDWIRQTGEQTTELTGVEQLIEDVLLLPFPDLSSRKPIVLPYSSIGTLFKGRSEFLQQLHSSLRRTTGTAATAITGRALHGLGGVGKTRLAVEYAWQHAEDYSAVLFITADSQSALTTNLAQLTGPLVLNLPEQDATEDPVKVATVLRWLSQHPGWFLILDNVDTEEAAEAVENLLPQLQQGQVLITSRLGSWHGQVQPLELDVLSPESAAQFLLERTAPQPNSARRGRKVTAEDESAATALATDLDGLALALEQAAGYIVTRRKSFTEYRQLWQQRNEAVRQWHDERQMQYPKSIATTWETTLEQVSSDERQLLNQLAWYSAEPIPLSLFRLQLEDSTWNLDAERLETAMVNLSDFSMVRWDADRDTVTVHRVVQEILRFRQPAASTNLTAALQRLEQAIPDDRPEDDRTWPAWLPLQAHVAEAVREGQTRNIAEPTATLMGQLGQLYQVKAQFTEAESLLRRALELSEQHHGPEHLDVATILSGLAVLLHSTNRHQEAESLYRRVLAIDESSYGPDHPDVATSLNNLANLLHSTNRHQEAEPLHRRALAIYESSYGPDHPDVATNLNNLAELLRTTNRPQEAEPLYRRALAIDEANYGPEHPTVAKSLSNLAGLLDSTNRHQEAEPLYRRASAIDEACYGPEHPEISLDLRNLAGTLESLNRHDEAELLYRRALAIDETFYGPEDPVISLDLDNLAGTLESLNRHDEAELLYRRALAIDEICYGPEAPAISLDLRNLAGTLESLDRLDEAELLYRRALAIDETCYGPEHPDVATKVISLAQFLQSMNRPEEAEQLYRRALAIHESCYGPDHPDVATDLILLANLLGTTKRSLQAEQMYRNVLETHESCDGPDHADVTTDLTLLTRFFGSTNASGEVAQLYRRAIEIRTSIYGPNHPDVAICLNSLAMELECSDRQDEAERLYHRVLAILESSYGREHTYVATILDNLAGLLESTQRTKDAEPLYRRALAIREAGYGPDHPAVATSLSNLAGLLESRKRFKEAERMHRRALTIFESSYGPDHPDVAKTLSNLATLLHNTQRTGESKQLLLRACGIFETYAEQTGHKLPEYEVVKWLNDNIPG